MRTVRSTHLHFTLVELLVVVAIIAVLASLLMPALSMARERARQTQCLANLKMIGLATALYADDESGYTPSWGMSGPSSLTAFWVDALLPYASVGNLWVCPSGPESRGANLWKTSMSTWRRDYMSIGINTWWNGTFVSIL